jgi:hypothetical protein
VEEMQAPEQLMQAPEQLMQAPEQLIRCWFYQTVF